MLNNNIFCTKLFYVYTEYNNNHSYSKGSAQNNSHILNVKSIKKDYIKTNNSVIYKKL